MIIIQYLSITGDYPTAIIIIIIITGGPRTL